MTKVNTIESADADDGLMPLGTKELNSKMDLHQELSLLNKITSDKAII
jgi:hypothetical protein